MDEIRELPAKYVTILANIKIVDPGFESESQQTIKF